MLPPTPDFPCTSNLGPTIGAKQGQRGAESKYSIRGGRCFGAGAEQVGVCAGGGDCGREGDLQPQNKTKKIRLIWYEWRLVGQWGWSAERPQGQCPEPEICGQAAGSPDISEADACELLPVVGHLPQLPARLHAVGDLSQVRQSGGGGAGWESLSRKMQGSSAPPRRNEDTPHLGLHTHEGVEPLVLNNCGRSDDLE